MCDAVDLLCYFSLPANNVWYTHINMELHHANNWDERERVLAAKNNSRAHQWGQDMIIGSLSDEQISRSHPED